MVRFVWRGLVAPGKIDEYIKKHDEIWPEMIAVMREAGVRNYSIWNCGNDLVGYYEFDGMEKKQKIYGLHKELLDRWNKHMGGIMEFEKDEAGNVRVFKQVFLME
jgi:L-rhamnose mutarotase